MFARVSTYQVGPDQLKAARDVLSAGPPSQVRELEGFRGAYAMLGQVAGTVMLVTLWDSEGAMDASTQVMSGVRATTRGAFGATGPEQVETFEVVSHP